MPITRKTWTNTKTITLDTTLADTPAIDYREVAGGFIRAIDDCGACNFYGATTVDGTYVPLYDSTNTIVARTMTNGRGYAFPDECFGCAFIKILPANDGRTIQYSLKT
jgi:hypothetical protein